MSDEMSPDTRRCDSPCTHCPGDGDAASHKSARHTDDNRSSLAYRELYFAARDHADTDREYVPHGALTAAFREHGGGHGVVPLRSSDEWLVWTPDSWDTPLYAYTPNLAGNTHAERTRVAELLDAAGVGTERFINVHDGHKESFDTGNARPPDDSEMYVNYGVKGGRSGDDGSPWLVDVDDYDTTKDSNPAVECLRDETLAVTSAHMTVDCPGHLYVAVDGDPCTVVRDVLGWTVDNPTTSFGKIRIDQRYVVGPSNEVLCRCSRCTDADTPESMGRDELASERPPVVWSEAAFRQFLLADPALNECDQTDDAAERDRDDLRRCIV